MTTTMPPKNGIRRKRAEADAQRAANQAEAEATREEGAEVDTQHEEADKANSNMAM